MTDLNTIKREAVDLSKITSGQYIHFRNGGFYKIDKIVTSDVEAHDGVNICYSLWSNSEHVGNFSCNGINERHPYLNSGCEIIAVTDDLASRNLLASQPQGEAAEVITQGTKVYNPHHYRIVEIPDGASSQDMPDRFGSSEYLIISWFRDNYETIRAALSAPAPAVPDVELTDKEVIDGIAKCESLDQLAGFLSTQRFSNKHPDYALRWVRELRNCFYKAQSAPPPPAQDDEGRGA